VTGAGRSPAAVLEREFLYEIGMLKAGGAEIVGRLSEEIGLRICELPFPAVLVCAGGKVGAGPVRPPDCGAGAGERRGPGHER
jgi:hypothetical protein